MSKEEPKAVEQPQTGRRSSVQLKTNQLRFEQPQRKTKVDVGRHVVVGIIIIFEISDLTFPPTELQH